MLFPTIYISIFQNDRTKHQILTKKNHLSQQELADKLSIPRSTLSDYEREHTQGQYGQSAQTF
ncbi:MAG: helix-turn-helix transcriptional regulator [Saprospiraceae bacterium]|nr:helix-turn-helix transcriptional regulator [Saprospiraceae bacterium]